jgi:hypothetical protein
MKEKDSKEKNNNKNNNNTSTTIISPLDITAWKIYSLKRGVCKLNR